jgi:nicotinate-nucleotide pyrophosphorylase (carboxylating)
MLLRAADSRRRRGRGGVTIATVRGTARALLASERSKARLEKVLAVCVRLTGPGVMIQTSGGITPETARAYAEAGAMLISIGALTHSAPAAL